MTAEEYIVEEYKATRLENLMLKTQLEAANKNCYELDDMLCYLLESAKIVEAEDSTMSNVGYIAIGNIWEDEDKTNGKLFDKVAQRIKSLNEEQSDE